MKFKLMLGLLLAISLLGTAPAVYAQADEEGSDDAPQILSSDLAQETPVTVDHLSVDFVIVDSDTITEVTIDGEPQQFEPSDTVLISKEFDLEEDRTLIRVTATDEQGNTRARTFLVLKPGAAVARTRLKPLLSFGVGFELDTNPSNDLSVPAFLSLKDDAGEDIKLGVVSDDEQADTRSILQAIFSLRFGSLDGFVGRLQQTYTKAVNERFNVVVNFVGLGYRSGEGKASGFVLRYTFTDIELGTFDYAVLNTISPGYESFSEDKEDDLRNIFKLDITSKDFASESQTDTTLFALKWNHRSTDKKDNDVFRSLIAIGTGSEGIEETEHQFVGLDFDWELRARAGFRVDIGFGWTYRNFPNDEPLSVDTPLGDTRVDNLLRFSLGPGWEFGAGWRAMLGYRYLFNLSNKSPYVRQIYGLTINGAF